MTAELHEDDRVPLWTDLALVPRVSSTYRHVRTIVSIVIVLALLVTAVVVAFRRVSDDITAVHHDTVASVGRVQSLTNQLASAANGRDRSLHEAALARAALGQARTAHLRSADALAAERDELDRARREAYISLTDQSAQNAQVEALHSCLDGVSQALNLLSVGVVDGWQHTLESIDGVCRRAESTTT